MLYLLSIRIPSFFAAEDPASQSLACKDAWSSGLKLWLDFCLCWTSWDICWLICPGSQSPLSSSPALLLSSAPLDLMSSENVPRLHSVLFSKPIYAWLLYLYISMFWSTHLYTPSVHHPNKTKKIPLFYGDPKEKLTIRKLQHKQLFWTKAFRLPEN